MHPDEARLLTALQQTKATPIKTSQIATDPKLGMNPDKVSRTAYSLSQKGLLTLNKLTDTQVSLTPEGREVLSKGLPEKLFLKILPVSVSEVPPELQRGMGWALKRGWAEKKGDLLVATVKTTPTTPEERALKNPSKATPAELDLLKKRKWVSISTTTDYEITLTPEGKSEKPEAHVNQLTPQMLLDGSWKKQSFTTFSPLTPVPKQWPGRFHPMTDLVNRVRQAFLSMGFTERREPFIESTFWDFDALFVPQDHPAREMQDTFYIEGDAPLPKDKALVGRVADIHKTCWGTWEKSEAEKFLLRTHTTCVSARTLAELKPPVKMFSVDKVFRNETLDYKHLAEFYQVEGIVYDPDVNFKHLLGYLKHFYTLMGFDKIRVRPAYFPYTEFSTEVDVWLQDRSKWIELGGAGIFRPEVVAPLTDTTTEEACPVLAWGLGLERLAMLYYGLEDIRQLYRSDITWLRQRREFT